jgi:hypothetical protein
VGRGSCALRIAQKGPAARYQLDTLIAAENARPVSRTIGVSLQGTWYADEERMLRGGVGVTIVEMLKRKVIGRRAAQRPWVQSAEGASNPSGRPRSLPTVLRPELSLALVGTDGSAGFRALRLHLRLRLVRDR